MNRRMIPQAEIIEGIKEENNIILEDKEVKSESFLFGGIFGWIFIILIILFIFGGFDFGILTGNK